MRLPTLYVIRKEPIFESLDHNSSFDLNGMLDMMTDYCMSSSESLMVV